MEGRGRYAGAGRWQGRARRQGALAHGNQSWARAQCAGTACAAGRAGAAGASSPVCQLGGHHQRSVRDLHAVVPRVPLLQAAQDLHSVGHRGLAHQHLPGEEGGKGARGAAVRAPGGLPGAMARAPAPVQVRGLPRCQCGQPAAPPARKRLLPAAAAGQGSLKATCASAAGQPSQMRGAPTHLLEAALKGGVLLHVLSVLGERGGADQAQLAACQHRLQQVGCGIGGTVAKGVGCEVRTGGPGARWRRGRKVREQVW